MKIDKKFYDVSVVVAVYKNVSNFQWTLKSVMRQTGCAFEVVVIDDGNSPEDAANLRKICGEYPNVRLHVNEHNVGLTKSLIKGCELAAAPFIARIDNGDIMIPQDRLNMQLAELKDSEFVICGGAMEVVDVPTGEVYQMRSGGVRREIKIENVGSVATLFPHVTVMFSKQAYLRCGGYNHALKVGQDTDLWPRMLKCGKGVSIAASLAVAPMWRESISVAKNNEQINGKILRLKMSSAGAPVLLSIVTCVRIVLEYFKMLIPVSYRNRLKLRKNYIYRGACFGRNAELSEIYDSYTSRR